MNSKTILVTGGCGYIGSHVTRQLSEAGWEPVVLDNLSTGFSEVLIHGERLVVGDVGDEGLLREVFSRYPISAVLHFAGSIIVPESVSDPLGYYTNNTVNALKLIRACTEAGVNRFVFSSTGSVYGENLAPALSEETPPAPTNPYSTSKLMTEWILRDTSRATPLRHVVLRYFNVAGADLLGRMGQRSKQSSHLIKVACEAVTGKRTEVCIFGEDYPTADGTGVRDYIHVEDLASAHLAALRYLERGGDSTVLNCGYGRGSSVREVLAAVEEQAGPLPIRRGPRRPGDVPSLVADVRKIHRTLDWQPRHQDLKGIVASALNWERRLAEEYAQTEAHQGGRPRVDSVLASASPG